MFFRQLVLDAPANAFCGASAEVAFKTSFLLCCFTSPQDHVCGGSFRKHTARVFDYRHRSFMCCVLLMLFQSVALYGGPWAVDLLAVHGLVRSYLVVVLLVLLYLEGRTLSFGALYRLGELEALVLLS